MGRSFEELLGEAKIEKNPSVTKRVFNVIHSKWPINPLEVADILGDNGKVKSLSAKYLYHFKKLKTKGLINMKRVGNTYIAWPTELDKLRVILDLFKGV